MQTKQTTDQKPKSWHRFWQVAVITLVVLAVAGAYVVHRIRQLPPELMQDIRAGIAARNITDPNQRFEKFLEGRYGPLTDPANQQKAFLGFFQALVKRLFLFLLFFVPVEEFIKKAHGYCSIQNSK